MTDDALTLAAGGARVAIVPALGGKIASLHLGGREWLWTSDVLPRVVPTEAVAADDAASYVHTADTGGFDECLPTVGATTLPHDARAYGGVVLPDHGELWSQHAPTERPAGQTNAAVTRWTGRRMPYALARTVRVRDDGTVHMDYALENRGDVPLPFLWSSHPLLSLTADTRLDLPSGARVRVWAQHGIDLGGERAEHRWPMLRADGRDVDFSRPGALPRGWACKLFLDLSGEAHATLAIEQGSARLEVGVATADVTHFGLWINHAGWTPFEGGVPYTNLAFEPCIGAPDPLAAALGAWNDAAWLPAGATRTWTLAWRAA